MLDANHIWGQSSHLNNFMWSSNVMKNKYDEQNRDIHQTVNDIQTESISKKFKNEKYLGCYIASSYLLGGRFYFTLSMPCLSLWQKLHN